MEIGDLLKDYRDRPGIAKGLGVSERSIARYEGQPNGLPSVLIGGRKLYHVPTVMAWVENRMKRPNPTRGRRAA